VEISGELQRQGDLLYLRMASGGVKRT